MDRSAVSLSPRNSRHSERLVTVHREPSVRAARSVPALAIVSLGLSMLFLGPTKDPAVANAVASAAASSPAACERPLLVRSAASQAGSESRLPGATVTMLPAAEKLTSDDRGMACLDELGGGTFEVVVTAAEHAVAVASITLDPGTVWDAPVSVTLEPAFGQEIVVTGTRTLKKLLEVPIHIQQIDRNQITASAARTLAEAVEFSSGIRVESNCQNCNTSQIRMLGLEGPYSQVVIDGQPTVSSLAMVYGIEQLPARLIDTIEVVKGGGSALYGAGAVGGTINLIPHQPDHTHLELSGKWLEIGGESGGSIDAVGDWAAEDRERTLTAFVQADSIDAADLDGDDFTEVTERSLVSLGARYEHYVLSSSGRLVADVSSTDEDRRGGDLLRMDRPAHETELTEEILSERVGATLSWLHSPSAGFDYRLAASWAATRRSSYYGGGFDPNAYGESKNPVAVLDSQFNRHLERATLSWGLQASQDEIEDVQLGYGRVIEESYDSLGLFVQDDRKLSNRVTALYGVRIDRHSALDDPVVSPRVALMTTIGPSLTVRGSIARGFRPPATFDEDLHITLVGDGVGQVVRNSPDLTEETSTAYLLSTEWRPNFGGKGSAAIELNAFRTDLDDLFDDRETDDPATPALELTKFNHSGARVQGVEFATALRWGSRWSGELGVVRQSARFDEPEPDFGSRVFLRTPRVYGSAAVRFSPNQRWNAFAGLLYTGSMQAPHYAGFIEEDRLETTPSFLTLDLNVSRTFATPGDHKLIVTVGVRNLTDEYQRDLDQGPARDSSYVYGPRYPRSAFLGLRLGL